MYVVSGIHRYDTAYKRLELLRAISAGVKNLKYNAVDLVDLAEKYESFEYSLMPLYKYASKQSEHYSYLQKVVTDIKRNQSTGQASKEINHYHISRRLDSVTSAIIRINSIMTELTDLLYKLVEKPVKEERIRLAAARQQAEIDAQPKIHLYTITVGLEECIDQAPHVDALDFSNTGDFDDRLFKLYMPLIESDQLSYLSYCKGIKNLDIVFEFYQTEEGKVVYSLYPDKELEEKMTKEHYERLMKTCKKAALDSLVLISNQLKSNEDGRIVSQS